jgi:hypothetical protein
MTDDIDDIEREVYLINLEQRIAALEGRWWLGFMCSWCR